MSRSFDIEIESPVSVQQIHATFGREDYWAARLKPSNPPTTLDVLEVDADGTVSVRATQHLTRQVLHPLIAKVVPGELKIVHSETWRPVGDGEVHGHIDVVTSAGIGWGRAEARVAPAGNGAKLRFAFEVAVKIPLLGRKLEKSMEADLVKGIPELQRFTSTWIAENT